MRKHSFLRRGSYRATPPGGGSVVIVNPVEGSESIWGAGEALSLLTPVYISGEDEVSAAEASTLLKVPSIGFVSSISGPSYTVRFNGELEGFEGLIPKQTYYLGEVGGIWTPTGEEDIWPTIIQPLGKAKNPTTILIEIGSPIPIQPE